VKALAAAALLLLLAAGTANSQQIKVEAHRDGDAVLVEARAHLKADAHLAWDVLTGYDQYARFVPDLKSSEILARAGNTAIVEQRGVAGFFLFRFPLEVRLAVTEQPYEQVSAQAIAGNFKEMTGLYRLVPEGEELRFTYSGRLVPAFGLPPLIGTAAVRIAVERQFAALVREILRREKERPL
jgi:ribosome-associated toxin RatA of RatAB toxin-antitoxin module